jgi:hypothetical protein
MTTVLDDLQRKEVLRLLEEGRAIIGDPARWTRGISARGASGLRCRPWHEGAVSFCSSGVLVHVARGWPDEMIQAQYLLDVEGQSQHGHGIVTCNDTLPHADVLAIWDATIANYRKELES